MDSTKTIGAKLTEEDLQKEMKSTVMKMERLQFNIQGLQQRESSQMNAISSSHSTIVWCSLLKVIVVVGVAVAQVFLIMNYF